MSNSSVLEDYLTISSSATLNSGAITGNITASNTTGSSYYYTTGAGVGGLSGSTITIGSGGAGINIANIDSSSFTWKLPEEFVDAFPDFDRIQKMCETYPGLKIALEKFKTTYYLVKDHYDTPEDQRPIP